MSRTRFFRSLIWGIALACLVCVGLNSGAQAESQKLTVRVMTRNMDAGTDLGFVANAVTITDFITGVLTTLAEIDASNIPARAKQLAAEISEVQPDLIALQEVSLWTIEFPGPARVYDQLAELQAALEAEGLHYRLALKQTLADLPAIVPPYVNARYTDFNAILVRADLPPGHLDVIGTETHLFENHLTKSVIVGPGQTIDFPLLNGWIAVDVKVRGARFKFANTHLLSALPNAFVATAAVQVAQGAELVEGLSATSLPVILAGDFNSDAVQQTGLPDSTQTAGNISVAGYTEVWHFMHPSETGFTWPLYLEDQPPLPFTIPFAPIERIDLIFSLGPTPISIIQTGTGPGSGGVYASDHVGVVADFDLENHRPDVPRGKK